MEIIHCSPEISALLKSLLRIAGGVLLAIPLLLYPFLYFFQEKLLFYPAPLDPDTVGWLHSRHAGSELSLAVTGGQSLHGWFIREKQPDAPVVIYFGGNSEDISWPLAAKKELPGCSMLAMAYRGYGMSTGAPSESALFADALAIYDYVAQNGIPPHRIILMGRSLGSGVAVYLASHREVAALVLVTPYDSITAVAQSVYPYAPMKFLLKHPFDSLSRASAIKKPVLILSAGEDRVIPPQHAETLARAWGGPVQRHTFPRAAHDSIADETRYWPIIHEFIQTVSKQ